MNFELILSTESKVLSTNIQTFEQQANKYLERLTKTFETDDDFARAEEEVKELKEIESQIRTAIDNVSKGNAEISELITTAELIAERFRQERLARDKLVKQKKAEIRENIINQAYEAVMNARHKMATTNTLSLALEITYPKNEIKRRLEECQKNKRTFDSLTKAVNAEQGVLLSEISAEITRLTNRNEQLNAKCQWLFPDAAKLIATQDDLAPIIRERIEAEQQREAELKAKAEQEAQAEKVQAEARAIADEMAQAEQEKSAENPQNATALEDFVITIRLHQIPQAQAIATARELKARFGENVSLNKAK